MSIAQYLLFCFYFNPNTLYQSERKKKHNYLHNQIHSLSPVNLNSFHFSFDCFRYNEIM